MSCGSSSTTTSPRWCSEARRSGCAERARQLGTGSGRARPRLRLGKILRIDPSAAAPYIPPANPFAADPTRAREIWHCGLRNPWRFSFDRLTGDLPIGDVGETAWEEVDFLAAGHAGGANLGWDVCEGNHDYSGSCTALPGAVPPVYEYSHSSGIGVVVVVVDGYVYRGTNAPALYGSYVFGDGATGRVLAWDRISAPVDIGVVPALSSFGEDERGELYALALFDGRIYRVTQTGGGGSGFPALLSQTGRPDQLRGHGRAAKRHRERRRGARSRAVQRPWPGGRDDGALRPHRRGRHDARAGASPASRSAAAPPV